MSEPAWSNTFAVALYRAGWSTRNLAMLYCIAHTTVARRLRKLGIKLRTRRAANRLVCQLGHVRVAQGERNGRWSGGRCLLPKGYVRVLLPKHPRANRDGYVLEHIVVAEAKLGRALGHGEEVHHIDRDRANNLPDNLTVLPRAEHIALHWRPGDTHPLVEARMSRSPDADKEAAYYAELEQREEESEGD